MHILRYIYVCLSLGRILTLITAPPHPEKNIQGKLTRSQLASLCYDLGFYVNQDSEIIGPVLYLVLKQALGIHVIFFIMRNNEVLVWTLLSMDCK